MHHLPGGLWRSGARVALGRVTHDLVARNPVAIIAGKCDRRAARQRDPRDRGGPGPPANPPRQHRRHCAATPARDSRPDGHGPCPRTLRLGDRGRFAPGASGSDDLAVASVVQLRPGVFDDAFYATWRADYDTAACAPAGGVASHARQQIGANAVEVTVCTGGARTYQTHLPGDILVSVTAVGARSFGERVMAGLRQ